MHEIERELCKVADFKPRPKYKNRQEYLKALCGEVNKVPDEDFDDCSKEATEWYNAAVRAINDKEDLPDFDEEVDVEETAEDEQADNSEAETDDPVENETETSEDDASEDEDEAEAEEKPKRGKAKEVKKAKGKAKAEPDEAEEDDEKPSKPTKKAGSTKPSKTPAHLDLKMNKWGVVEGSKNAEALDMFEKGTTTREVKDEIGGTYYNILKKMVERGHTLEKDGTYMKLIHKDDSGKKKVKSKVEPEPEPKKAKKK